MARAAGAWAESSGASGICLGPGGILAESLWDPFDPCGIPAESVRDPCEIRVGLCGIRVGSLRNPCGSGVRTDAGDVWKVRLGEVVTAAFAGIAWRWRVDG